jgi:hypothetical protein
MNWPTIVSMPTFAEGKQRVGRRGYPRPVIVCRQEERQLQSLAASQLFPFAHRSDTLSALLDVYLGPTGLVRRCRKRNGAAFSAADIDRPDSMALDDFVASILAEPDHPYRAMLSHHDRALPIVHPAEGYEWAPDPAIEWKGRIIVVDDEIFVPTLTPTLAVSLDRERGILVAAASCPPTASPALRMPTIHLPYETDAATLTALARDLEVGLEFDPPLEMLHPCGPAASEWIIKTLADFYRYLVRKGVRAWPEDLPFDVLRRAYQADCYADAIPADLEWFGQFLDEREDKFGHLASYIEGLQVLIFARYRVVGDELPPLPTDVLL